MRTVRGAFILSGVLHGSIVLAAVVAFPEPEAPSTPPVNALPVNLVTVAEKTDVTQGAPEAAEVVDEAAPRTVTEADEAAAPEVQPGATQAPAERIATESEAVDTASRSAAPEPAAPESDAPESDAPETEEADEARDPPETTDTAEPPETAPASPPDAARLPEETSIEADATPPPEAAAGSSEAPPAVPAPRPTPPRRTETARVERETVETFDAETISQLINRDAPSGGGQGTATASLGSERGRAQARLTLSEQDYLRAQMQRCWSPPVGVRGSSDLIITVQFKLAPDGRVTEIVEVAAEGVGRVYDVAADAARRAVLRCQPYSLPPEKYAAWKEVRVNFDPRELF